MRGKLWTDFIFEVGAGIYVVAVVVFFWRRPGWLSLLLAGGLGMQLWFWREKADAATMAAAALLGTPAEILCVKLGVWTYHAPGLIFDIPAWIPLVWAFLFCFFRRVSLSIHAVALLLWPSRQMFPRKIFFGVLGGMIVVYYLVTVAVIRRIIAAAYTTLMVPAVVFWRGERDILIFLIGAACGTLGEYICMRLGFWQYHYPFFRFVGMPISLPLAWGLSAVVIGRIASTWEPKEKPDPQRNG